MIDSKLNLRLMKPKIIPINEVESFKVTYPSGHSIIRGDLITPTKLRSNIELEPEELSEKVSELENSIKDEPIENILAIDEFGNVIMHNIGDIDSAPLEMRFWNAAKIVTHNHPNNSVFSGVDVSHLFDTECEEIRVVTKHLWHSIRRGENTPDLNAETVKTEIDELINSIIFYAVKYAGELNNVEFEIIDENGITKIDPIQTDDISDEEFTRNIKQAKLDGAALYKIYTAEVLKKYADEHNFIYETGEL